MHASATAPLAPLAPPAPASRSAAPGGTDAAAPTFGAALQRQLAARQASRGAVLPAPAPVVSAPPPAPTPADNGLQPVRSTAAPAAEAATPAVATAPTAAPAPPAGESDDGAQHMAGNEPAGDIVPPAATPGLEPSPAAGGAGVARTTGSRHDSVRAAGRHAGAHLDSGEARPATAASDPLAPAERDDAAGAAPVDAEGPGWVSLQPAAFTAEALPVGALQTAAEGGSGGTSAAGSGPGARAGRNSGTRAEGRPLDLGAAAVAANTIAAAANSRALQERGQIEHANSAAHSAAVLAAAGAAGPADAAVVAAAALPAAQRPRAGDDAGAIDVSRLAAAAAGLQPAVLDAPTGAREGAPSARATLDVPIEAPGFGAALGARVSLLATDGMQQAEVHLYPAETGPIHVRIALDRAPDGGAVQARVEFHAELQATRDAIEASLPGLAASLREQGFTLAGGGVFHGAPGREGSGNGDADGDGTTASRRDGRRAGTAGVATVEAAATRSQTLAAAARRSALAGGLDVYA